MVELLDRHLCRRQFLCMSSMAAAGILAAHPRPLMGAEVPAEPSGPAATDGTRYGQYIHLSVKSEATERGIAMFGSGITFPEFSTIIIGRMPAPGPMPGHETHEKHDGEKEYLIHLGNDPKDPLNLGADAELYLGRGKWREKHTFNTATAVYLPSGFWHCPWHIKKIRTDMTWVNVRIGGKPAQGPPQLSDEALPPEELAKAKTGGYVFSNLMLSGVSEDRKDPAGGKWIAYTDCTLIAEAPLTRIIRYLPDKAPYDIIGTQTHEYGTLFLLLGTDLSDPTDLGAEVDVYMGPEKEKHTITQSAMIYAPADTVHGPFAVKNAKKPFNFLEIVAGPELPGAVYG